MKAKKTKKKQQQVSLSVLKDLIDKAGEQLVAKTSADALYKATRVKLEEALKDAVGIDVWVEGQMHKAGLIREKETCIDVLDVIAAVKEELVLKEILSVRIKQARELLTPEQRQDLITERFAEKPTLKVTRRKEVKETYAAA